MTNKMIGIFDASLIYDELEIYFEYPEQMPTTMQRVAIAYLIDKECCVTFSPQINAWYRQDAVRMNMYNLDKARRIFYECFDYFLFAAMAFENIYLQFSGHTVFVSNFVFDLKDLNRKRK